MTDVRINIACGDSYLDDWINFDYAPHSASVRQANLLSRLPVTSGTVGVVYSSHFLEHIPHQYVASFLADCFRITKSGGHLRFVLPDFEELCTTYLKNRRSGEHEMADFLVLEILDQCVRTVPGGELGAYYGRISALPKSNQKMLDYVRHRTGYTVQVAAKARGGGENGYDR